MEEGLKERGALFALILAKARKEFKCGLSVNMLGLPWSTALMERNPQFPPILVQYLPGGGRMVVVVVMVSWRQGSRVKRNGVGT